ncbi:hypothetical protein RvY_07530-2 [Ramazzottius varieornatus]|nr:hypothetical protein RvY_07530-2 [Ramazzottius varieornatus]
MRVPWWLRTNLTRSRQIMDRNFKPFIDNPQGFDKLPEHYKKAYMEARTRTPIPVHYKPVEVPYEYDPELGKIVRIEDTHPIEPYFPPEAEYGLWGGEGFIRGYTMPEKSKGFRPKNCRWWWPKLSQVTLYSEILDKHMLTIVTRRTLDLIDDAKGFDHYILRTHQVDLASKLGMRLKREMLVALAKGEMYPGDPEKTKSLLEKYKEYVVPLEIAEWTGLTLAQAERKYNREQQRDPVPLKHIFREQLLLELHRHKESGEALPE